MLLLCWSECNRPGFFSLTTGACEHTSSPPWERRLSRQSQCLCLVFSSCTVPSCFSSMSLSHPVLISVLFVLSVRLLLSLSLYITQGDIIFPPSKWKEKHLGDVQSGLAVKSLEHLPLFRETLIETSGSGGTTNKLEM